MTTTALRVTADTQTQVRTEHRAGALIMKLLTTTDHKVIGKMYLWTALAFFGFGGLLALAIRAELAFPGLQFLHVRAVQPVLHDARHDHAADVRDADVRRLRQRDHAAADRRARRRVPAAERVLRTGCSCSARSSPARAS